MLTFRILWICLFVTKLFWYYSIPSRNLLNINDHEMADAGDYGAYPFFFFFLFYCIIFTLFCALPKPTHISSVKVSLILRLNFYLTLKRQEVHLHTSSLDGASAGWYDDVPVSIF